VVRLWTKDTTVVLTIRKNLLICLSVRYLFKDASFVFLLQGEYPKES